MSTATSTVMSTAVSSAISTAVSQGGAPFFSRKYSGAIDTLLGYTNGAVWDYDKKGDYLYAAAATEGCYVIDVSDPENPTQVDTDTLRARTAAGAEIYTPTTDVLVIGDYLFLCGRSIDWASDNEAGIVTCYNISNPASPVYADTYQPASMANRPYVPGSGYGQNWFQGMSTDGTYLYVASQFAGLTVLDISNPETAITEHGTYDRYDLMTAFADDSGVHAGATSAILTKTGAGWTTNEWVGYRVTNKTQAFDMIVTSNTATTITGTIYGLGTVSWDASDEFIINEVTFYWETSRCVYSAGWVYMGTHGNGVIALDVSTPASPTNPQWYDAPVVDPFGDGNEQIRVRYVVTDGDYLYACTNQDAATPERGLLIMDISDPTAVDVDDWIYSPIGKSYNETSDYEGDRPCMRLVKYGNYCYIGNGDRGQAVFDVTDPTAPVMVGLRGTNVPAGTSTYGAYFFASGDKTYAYYSDGPEKAVALHNLYVDEITDAPATEYIVGLAPEDALSASGEISTNTTIELSSAEERPIVIKEWTEVYEIGCFAASSSGASRVAVVGLFNAVLDTGARYLPTTAVQDSSADVEAAISIPGGTTKAEHTEAVSFLIPPGTYMLKTVTSGLTRFLDNYNTTAYLRYRYSSGTYPTLVDPTAAATNRTGGDIVMWMRCRSISS